jgi:hypothetical protein
MGIWKVGCNVRLPPESKAALEEFAKRERRTFGNLCAVLMEWSLAQLQKAGSTERLLRHNVPTPRDPAGNHGRKTAGEVRPEQVRR